jgi:hypothetical protein
MNFDIEWNLQEFREEQKELFDNENKRMTGVSLDNRTAEIMLKLIDDMESEIKRLEEKNKKNEFMIEKGIGQKNKILEIIHDLDTGDLTGSEAEKKVLDLFSHSKRCSTCTHRAYYPNEKRNQCNLSKLHIIDTDSHHCESYESINNCC